MSRMIHQSSLNMALRCGEQYRRRYVEGHVVPPSIAAARGTGVHTANEVNLQHKIAKGQDLPLSDILDATRDGYVRTFEKAGNQVYLPRDEWAERRRLMNEGLNDALRCAAVYQKDVAPGIHPVAIEQEFRLEVPGVELPIAGRMDYQELPVIGDLKTSNKSWPVGRIDEEIQPVFYAYAHERTMGFRPDFIYHILIARRGKNGPTSTELQTQTMKPTDQHFKALFAKLQLFCKMLKTGTFMPANPTSWWCSEKWCGYWATCPYVGN